MPKKQMTTDAADANVTEGVKQEPGNFLVSLPMQVRANSPEEAVEAFLEQTLQYGMRPWDYNVIAFGNEDDVLGERSVVSGHGERRSSDVTPQDEPTAGDDERGDEAGASGSDAGTGDGQEMRD